MGSYSISEATKRSLIMAAGELFTEHGVKEVTTRAIAKKAGANIGLIDYHFGGKNGLFEAVVDFAMEKWRVDPMGSFLRDNIALFETREGQCRLVTGLIDTFFGISYSKDYPAWCGILIFQLMQRELPISRRIHETCINPIIRAFNETYSRITGNNDKEMAFCWLAMTFGPMRLVAIDPSIPKMVFKRAKLQESFLRKLRAMTVKCSLLNLGLHEG